MKKSQAEKVVSLINETEKNYGFNTVMYYLSIEEIQECETADEVIELIKGKNDEYEITDTDIVGNSTAMNFLRENDPSLTESLELASLVGFETKNLNSEKLASILACSINRDDFAEFCEKIRESIVLE